MRLCIYEDPHYRNLLPLVWTRPVYHLRCGISLLDEKITARFPKLPPVYHCREILTGVLSETAVYPVNSFEEDSYLLVNGRTLMDEKTAKHIDLDRHGCVYCAGDTEIAAVLSGDQSRELRNIAGKPLVIRERFPGLHVEQVEVNVIRYPWDLISGNEEEIRNDFTRIYPVPAKKGECFPGSHLVNGDLIHIGGNAKVKPGAVLNAENGPVVIEEGAEIMANAVVEGPAFIGRKSKIKIGAKIYEGTSIGEICKVGGEVESTIIHSFSNKQHDGFLGHAYLGQWVNLGADTNNSDLKNNYHSVKVTIDGKTIDTGQMFVGLIMGDHTKTGINTMFNTGTVAGAFSNIYGAGFPPKYIPSFSWGGSEGFVGYELEKAIDTARAVMARRGVELTTAAERLAKFIFNETAKERENIVR